MLGGLARGVVVGLGWGVLARLFMRLVSTEPAFSWAGTLMIVALGVVFWGLVSLVAAARSQGRSRWWRLAGLPSLILFVGQGIVFLPGALLVAAGLAVRTAWQRAALVVSGLGGTYWLLTVVDDERFLAPRTQALGYAIAAICAGMLGVGLYQWLRRWSPRAGLPGGATRGPAAYDTVGGGASR